MWVLALLTLYRIACLWQPHLVLFYDEAQYYHWSLVPDWGYYSKPPMVAWLIAVTTGLFGDSVVAVKLASPLLYAATALVMYRIGAELFDARTGALAGWVFLTTMLVGFNSLFITTDAPLIFFWAATLWAFVRTQANPQLRNWVLLGVLCGLGMLSKYTMAALPGSLFLYLLVDSERRAQLMRPGPWIAAVVAGLIFATNIYWNWQNGFVSFLHTGDISGIDENWLHPDELGMFLASQILAFGPIWLWLWLQEGWRQQRASDSSQALLWWVSLPLLLVISMQALVSHAYINWAGPTYIGAVLIVASVLARYGRRLWLIGGLLQLLLLSLVYHWPPLLDNLGITRDRDNDPWFRVLGWDEVGALVQPLFQENPEARLTSESRRVLAIVGYYATPGELRLARWNSNSAWVEDTYDQRFNLRQFQGDSDSVFIWVSESPVPEDRLAAFASFESLGMIEVPIYHNRAHRLYLYRAQEFLGYEGGQPPEH